MRTRERRLISLWRHNGGRRIIFLREDRPLNPLKRIIVVFFVLMAVLLPLSADAETTALQAKASFRPEGVVSVISVTPHRLVIPAGSKTGIVSVVNKSEKERRYTLRMADQVMDESGATWLQDGFIYSAAGMTKFVPKEFSVQPGQRQVVRVLVSRPEGLADGDYHSHLVFSEIQPGEEDKKEVGSKKAPYGIAMPLVIQQGRIDSAIAIGDVRLGGGVFGQPRLLTVELTRQGNAEATGKISARYLREGHAPVDLVRPQRVYLYREVKKIRREFRLSKLPEDAAGGKIVVYLMRDENDDSKTLKQEISVD